MKQIDHISRFEICSVLNWPSQSHIIDVLWFQLEFFLSMDWVDPLDWWSRHHQAYPYISVLARRIFTVNATSVASERLFSLSGHIVNKKRTSLRPSIVNVLTVLAFNTGN